MSYTVRGDLSHISLNEIDTINSVLQNVGIILATRKGSVPMYRDFGLSQECLDKPQPVAKAMLLSDIREAVETYEPRAEVVRVYFDTPRDNPGVLIPIVEVDIKL